MIRALTESPRYTKFTGERDKGLERVLAKYSRALHGILETIERQALLAVHHTHTILPGRENLAKARHEYEQAIKPFFNMAIDRSVSLIQSLRKTTYIITMVGQAEAIGRATVNPTTYKISKHLLSEFLRMEAPSGGTLEMRMELAFHRLLRDVLDAFQLSQVLESPPQETMERIKRAFPNSVVATSTRSVMAKMKEAERSKDDMPYMAFGTIDPEDWARAVDDYMSDEIPFGRAPYDKIFYAEASNDGIYTYMRYSWQVEQEMTNDFVQSVREGENETAKQNGIDEFQWIAIVDTKTDECCTARDGLTTKEIEDGLASGKISDDCDATVAPAHFNCRCRMAPMSEDMPEETPPDFGSFDDWLQERAAA